jgi:hypothetical protein
MTVFFSRIKDTPADPHNGHTHILRLITHYVASDRLMTHNILW